MSAKPKRAIHTVAAIWIFGRIVRPEEKREVVVLARSGNYFMIKRPRCMPYVAWHKEVEVLP